MLLEKEKKSGLVGGDAPDTRYSSSQGDVIGASFQQCGVPRELNIQALDTDSKFSIESSNQSELVHIRPKCISAPLESIMVSQPLVALDPSYLKLYTCWPLLCYIRT
jgi:hypothetical protein